jgi:hypothetical protein
MEVGDHHVHNFVLVAGEYEEVGWSKEGGDSIFDIRYLIITDRIIKYRISAR